MLPRLATLQSPLNFANLLIPERPIMELQITRTQELSLNGLQVLSTGSQEILRLRLGLRWADIPEIIGSIADIFPRLRSLDLLHHGVVVSMIITSSHSSSSHQSHVY